MEPTHPSVIVRAYHADDRAACLEVFDTNVPRFFSADERAEFAAFLDAPPGPYLVLVEDGGALVGCGGYAVRLEDGVADLCWGMVRRDRHGQGLGRALAAARIERIVGDARASAVALNTSQHTVPFYERMGFRTLRVVEGGYAPGLDRCEMWMELGRDGEAKALDHPELGVARRTTPSPRPPS